MDVCRTLHWIQAANNGAPLPEGLPEPSSHPWGCPLQAPPSSFEIPPSQSKHVSQRRQPVSECPSSLKIRNRPNAGLSGPRAPVASCPTSHSPPLPVPLVFLLVLLHSTAGAAAFKFQRQVLGPCVALSSHPGALPAGHERLGLSSAPRHGATASQDIRTCPGPQTSLKQVTKGSWQK